MEDLPGLVQSCSIGAMRNLVLLAASALALQPAAAEAQLPPTGKWTVDFGDARCLAYRAYGPESRPLYLLIKPSPIGDVLQLQLAEKGSDRQGVQEEARLSFDGGTPIQMSQLRYGSNGKHVRMVNLSRDLTARLAAARALHWSARGKEYQLELGPVDKLVRTVGECRVKLGDYWNGTPEKMAALAKGPRLQAPSIISLFESDDYPSQAVTKDQSGMAQVVALIDEKGGVADCTVIETSGVAVLDAQTCIIITRRGKFDAAFGADGMPAKGIYTQRVRWEMSN